jgi:hypothetical protein
MAECCTQKSNRRCVTLQKPMRVRRHRAKSHVPNITAEFDVHGSVHLGNIYVKFKDQLDVLFMYSLFFLFLALHVSGAICTHPQEHNCSVQP